MLNACNQPVQYHGFLSTSFSTQNNPPRLSLPINPSTIKMKCFLAFLDRTASRCTPSDLAFRTFAKFLTDGTFLENADKVVSQQLWCFKSITSLFPRACSFKTSLNLNPPNFFILYWQRRAEYCWRRTITLTIYFHKI